MADSQKASVTIRLLAVTDEGEYPLHPLHVRPGATQTAWVAPMASGYRSRAKRHRNMGVLLAEFYDNR
jgi:hypothetical protein